jgi:hypothetical protein
MSHKVSALYGNAVFEAEFWTMRRDRLFQELKELAALESGADHPARLKKGPAADRLTDEELRHFLRGGRYCGLIKKIAASHEVHYSTVSKAIHGALDRVMSPNARVRRLHESILTSVRAEMARVDSELKIERSLDPLSPPKPINRDSRLAEISDYRRGGKYWGIVSRVLKKSPYCRRTVNMVIAGTMRSPSTIAFILAEMSLMDAEASA